MPSWDGTRDRSKRDSRSGINEKRVYGLLGIGYWVLGTSICITLLDSCFERYRRGLLSGVLQSLPPTAFDILYDNQEEEESNRLYITG